MEKRYMRPLSLLQVIDSRHEAQGFSPSYIFFGLILLIQLWIILAKGFVGAEQIICIVKQATCAILSD